MLSLTVACHTSAPSEETSRGGKTTAERDHDASVIAKRGWAKSELNIMTPTDDPPTVSSGETVLGPFRLGMTIDTVRRVARQAGVTSNGSFNSWRTQVDAWCAPPTTPGGIGVILAPTALNFVKCHHNGHCQSYDLAFRPVGLRLRLAWADRFMTKDKDKKIGSNAAPMAHGPMLAPCELTSAEKDKLARWDRLEESALVDKFGPPELDVDRLPPALMTALRRWEKSVTVADDPAVEDGFALSPDLDGYWRGGPYYLMGYTLNINGEGAYAVPYVVVCDLTGKIVWAGDMAEYQKHQMAGKQRRLP